MRNTLPKLAIALDAPSIEPLEPILDQLAGLPVLIKVGMSLFSAVGPSIVHHVRLAGFDVFLDLKLHDIPHQVRLAVEAVARLDVAVLTVHLAGGRAMLEVAVQAARGRTRVVGVSVLSSLDDASLAETGVATGVRALVAERVRLAAAVGLDGVVLATHELDLVPKDNAAFLRVVPGIRAAGGGDDQARTATADEALRAGASMLVVGRPVVASPDPRAAVQALLSQIATAALLRA